MPDSNSMPQQDSLERQDNYIIDLIRRKHATRRFLDQAVDEANIRQIVDMGRRAGSWKNRQPWTFVVITDRDILNQIADLNENARHVRGAAFVVAMIGTRPSLSGSPQFDYGRAAQNMMLAAEAYGIGSVIGHIPRRRKTGRLLRLPPAHFVEWVISFGYPTPDFDKVGHRRRPLDAVLHWNRWGE